MDVREIVQFTTWVMLAVGFIIVVWVIVDSCREALEAWDALERERELLEIEIIKELEK